MVKKRSQFHYAVRRVKKKAELTRAEHLFEASLTGDTNILTEMKKIRCGGVKTIPDLPDTVGGAQGEEEIAMKFKTVYETLYNSADTKAEITQLLGPLPSRGGNNSGSWDPSSQKTFGLTENFQ